MRNYAERPHCRSAIEHLCKKYNCDLMGLWDLNGEIFTLSKNLKLQLKKMLGEQGLKAR